MEAFLHADKIARAKAVLAAKFRRIQFSEIGKNAVENTYLDAGPEVLGEKIGFLDKI